MKVYVRNALVALLPLVLVRADIVVDHHNEPNQQPEEKAATKIVGHTVTI